LAEVLVARVAEVLAAVVVVARVALAALAVVVYEF
jgi:hypothetical protein